MKRKCEKCGELFTVNTRNGRSRKYCTATCKQRAYLVRRDAW